MSKEDFQNRFSGQTRALLRLLVNIFLDSGLDIRQKQMFGHVAFSLNGHTFLLVGEWPREISGQLVIPGNGKERAEPTAIFTSLGGLDAGAGWLMKLPGSGYFAPGGTRLKSWVSLTGTWLLEEEELAPLVRRQLENAQKLPVKKIKNASVAI